MRTKYLLTIGLGASLLFLGLPSSSVSAASAGQKCKKVGLLSGTKKAPLVCSKVRGKLVWKSSQKVVMNTTTTVRPKATDTTMVAKGKATPTTSLTTTTTTIADTTTTTVLAGTVSQRNAVKKGASYLKFSSFSRTGLIGQLQYEGFSLEDATYGTDAQNADWNAQAGKKAASYLEYSSFSRSGLIGQLLYEGFTQAQAEYGVGSTGL